MIHVSGILLAGGRGVRMNQYVPKQFLSLHGKMIVLHSFETLLACPYISEIVIVCEADYRSYFTSISKPLKFALPGERRQDSVYNGLQCISETAELVCIHDSARPFLLAGDVLRVIEEAKTHGAAVLGSPVKNTLKESDGASFIKRTIDRSPLWEVYTPQVMTPTLLRQGYAIAHAHNRAVTDDVSLVELTGHPVKLVHGSSKNSKITTPEDLVPEAVSKLLCSEKSMILRSFESGSQAATAHQTKSTPSGSIEEEGLKGPQKGDFNGQMSFETASYE